MTSLTMPQFRDWLKDGSKTPIADKYAARQLGLFDQQVPQPQLPTPQPMPAHSGRSHQSGLFDEQKHPRERTTRGSKHAGQFAPKNTASTGAPPKPVPQPQVDPRRQLFDEHAGRVPAIVRSILGNHPDADDAIQNANMALWKATDGYDPSKGDFGPYANQAIRNAIRMQGRTQSRRDANLPTASLNQGGGDSGREQNDGDVADKQGGNPLSNAIHNEDVARVRDALGQINSTNRDLLLRKMNGESQADMARGLGVSEAAVSKRIQKAISELHSRFREHFSCQLVTDRYGKVGAAAGQMSLLNDGNRTGRKKQAWNESKHPRHQHSGDGRGGQFASKHAGQVPVKITDHADGFQAVVKHPQTGETLRYFGETWEKALQAAGKAATQQGFTIQHPKKEPQLGGLFADKMSATATLAADRYAAQYLPEDIRDRYFLNGGIGRILLSGLMLALANSMQSETSAAVPTQETAAPHRPTSVTDPPPRSHQPVPELQEAAQGWLNSPDVVDGVAATPDDTQAEFNKQWAEATDQPREKQFASPESMANHDAEQLAQQNAALQAVPQPEQQIQMPDEDSWGTPDAETQDLNASLQEDATRSDDCGAGEDGRPGFQAGNDCGANESGEPTLEQQLQAKHGEHWQHYMPETDEEKAAKRERLQQQSMADKAGSDYQSQVPPRVRAEIDAFASQHGVTPEQLWQHAQQEHEIRMGHHESWQGVLGDARQQGMNKNTTRRMENSGRDHDAVTGYDTFLDEAQNNNPQLDWGNDPADTLWGKLNEGAQPAPKLHDPAILKTAVDTINSAANASTPAVSADYQPPPEYEGGYDPNNPDHMPFSDRRWTGVQRYSERQAALEELRSLLLPFLGIE